MIYSTEQLKIKILEMINVFETEAVEFKEARVNYSFNDIGKYFSALSNEANLRSLKDAWLIFGVTNQKEIHSTQEGYFCCHHPVLPAAQTAWTWGG